MKRLIIATVHCITMLVAFPGITQDIRNWNEASALGGEIRKWQEPLMVNGITTSADRVSHDEFLRKVSQADICYRPVLESLIARSEMVLGDASKARGWLSKLSEDASVAPECLFWLHELSGVEGVDSQYMKALVRIIPITHFGSLIEYSERPPKPGAPLEDMKRFDGDTMHRIAFYFEQAQLYDYAWRAYTELIYGKFSAARLKEPRTNTWLSEQAAVHWLSAAVCARKARRVDLAWGFLLKSAVYGGSVEGQFAEREALKWLASEANKFEVPLAEGQRRIALSNIVQLYVTVNAHPRALQLLDDYPDAFEDATRLRREIEQQWLAVVKDVSRTSKKVTLYGVQVYPAGDPLKLRIPWAFSDEALHSIRERIR